MRWYWWVVTAILALNVFVIIAVAVFMVYARVRKRGMLSKEERRGAGSDEKR